MILPNYDQNRKNSCENSEIENSSTPHVCLSQYMVFIEYIYKSIDPFILSLYIQYQVFNLHFILQITVHYCP